MRLAIGFAASVSLAFLMGSVSTAAQSGKYGKAQVQNLYPPYGQQTVPSYTGDSIVLTGQRVGQACPVSLRAQHGADGTILKVDKLRPQGIAQKLHLTLTSKGSRQIVAARLRVRGVSGNGQLIRTDTAQSSMDYTRNLTVHLLPGADNEATGDAWVTGMSAVLQLELSSVTFDDGSMQRFTAPDGCRFTPDHLMLIAEDGN